MFVIKRFLSLLGYGRDKLRKYALDEESYSMLESLAVQEQRPAEAVHADILIDAYEQRCTNEALFQRWQALSYREKDVTALTCLGYTNRQIAARMHVSPETVKSYLRVVLVKVNLHSKADLRVLFSRWNFNDWGAPAEI